MSSAVQHNVHGLHSPATLRRALEATSRYYLDDAQLDRVWLALRLGKPLLVEGEAGCGKTELARALPRVLGTELIRVTCGAHTRIEDLFFHSDRERPPGTAITPGALWRAIRRPDRSLVLIDELDKAPVTLDHALLEWLEEFKFSDPLLGAIEPLSRPYVVLTSNTTRPLSEQLRDRCVFLYFEYPAPEREAEILRSKSGTEGVLATQVAYLCRAFREIGFKSPPSIREALDMIEACKTLGITLLTETSLSWLLPLAVKRRDDAVRAEKHLPVLYARAVEIAEEHAVRLTTPLRREHCNGTGGNNSIYPSGQEIFMQTTQVYDEEAARRHELERERRDQEEREREQRRREEEERARAGRERG